MQCTNNLKQFGLGLHNYHDTYKSFVYRRGGTGGCNSGNTARNQGNCQRLAGYIPLLPFVEGGPQYDQIMSGDPTGTTTNVACPAQGPCAWCDWTPWRISPGLYRCPSDPTVFTTGTVDQRQSNYGFSVGDQVQNALGATPNRGLFATQIGVQMAEITDGTSNTIMMSERLKSNFGLTAAVARAARQAVGYCDQYCQHCRNPRRVSRCREWPILRHGSHGEGPAGSYWTDGQFERVGFNTVLPPNEPVHGRRQRKCRFDKRDPAAVKPPSSAVSTACWQMGPLGSSATPLTPATWACSRQVA